ncbi:hypothetical protein AB8U03_17340 [Clostridium sp. Mt-5]|uniref:Uncharacterized protein n=1 Tax=Clostridium moutaii TaxID=3240932 RepID=A0ABV4BYH8_9CLOT
MATKKEQILNLVAEGKTLVDILQLGFNKKYVKEVIRETNKKNGKNLGIDKSKNDVITQMQNEIKDIKELLKEHSSVNKKESSGDDKFLLKKQQLNQALKILNFLKNNEQVLNCIQLDINITITNIQKNQKSVNVKLKGTNNFKINPIEIYRNNGEVTLRELLNSFNLEQLKYIARQYTPDARGYVYKWSDSNKIIDYIVERSTYLSEKGSVFVTDRNK